jgi:hypothetical protein
MAFVPLDGIRGDRRGARMSRATFTASFRALEIVRDDGAARLIEARMFSSAAAHIAIVDNAIDTARALVVAVMAAAAGDQDALSSVIADLRLDAVGIRP